MEKFEFTPVGVCSRKMIIEVDDGIIKSYKSIGGCPGNSLGLGSLLVDMSIDEAIEKLEGTKCGMRQTSCPNELAKALIKIKK